jgi:uncharacterized protein YfiM (DUF2279 family)
MAVSSARPGRASRPLALLALALAPTVSRAEPWWGPDKVQHFGSSYVAGGAVYGGLWLAGHDPPGIRFALAASLGVLPGLAKEIYDAGQPDNRFSGPDLVWDGLGALAGAATLLAVELLYRRIQTGDRGHVIAVKLAAGARAGALLVVW